MLPVGMGHFALCLVKLQVPSGVSWARGHRRLTTPTHLETEYLTISLCWQGVLRVWLIQQRKVLLNTNEPSYPPCSGFWSHFHLGCLWFLHLQPGPHLRKRRTRCHFLPFLKAWNLSQFLPSGLPDTFDWPSYVMCSWLNRNLQGHWVTFVALDPRIHPLRRGRSPAFYEGHAPYTSTDKGRVLSSKTVWGRDAAG